MEYLFYVLLGIGLAAACGFRVFVPFLAISIAAMTGQLIAAGFILLGLLNFYRGAGIGGLWIGFIGLFLLTAARGTYAQVKMKERLRGVRVADVMARDYPRVDGRTNLQTFVDEYVLHTGRRCHLIVENGAVAGLITPHEIKAVDRARWPHTTVHSAMIPIERLKTVSPQAFVAEALEMLARDDINQLPVVANGRIEGVISRDRVMQFLTTRAELEM